MWKMKQNSFKLVQYYLFKNQHFHTCRRHVNWTANFNNKRVTNWNLLKCFLSTEKSTLRVHEYHLEIEDNSLCNTLSISHMWLRDHCRCNLCYNFKTNQRKVDILDIQNTSAPVKCTIQDNVLHLTWKDDHKSTYPLHWLESIHNSSSKKVSPLLWDKDKIKYSNVCSMNIKEFNTDKGLKEFMISLLKYGVAFVKNVQPTLSATEKTVQRITHVQRSFFGDMWEFSDVMEHQDSAYSKEALGAHTDNTYFSEAAGLQIFHCLHHDGKGGETLLVDGFYAAQKLREKFPDSFQRLTETVIESEFVETGKHYLSAGPVLRLSPITKEVEQIRFNVYDRAPMKTLPSDKVLQFYEDYINLSSIIADPQHEWWLKLSPGTILFCNNWRILHGRAAYTGHRKIAGCYVGHSDWLSIARVLGLL